MTHVPFAAIYWRLFFIQAFWNYPRMLGVGFLFALHPVARFIYPDLSRRIEFLKRHVGYFNAQPYCASLAVGYILRRETDMASSGEASSIEICEVLKTKEDLCGMLGLVGDQIFWQLLKPETAALAMIAALLTALAAGEFGIGAALVGAVSLLLIFNPLHLWMRWWGLRTGFQAGDSLPEVLASGIIPTLRRRLAQSGVYIALALTLTAFTFARSHFGAVGWSTFSLGFASMIIMQKARTSIHTTLVVVALISLIPILLHLD
jgi:mannose/fructose/N-acetylgalactosamine-specific phosphotransferase system component IID